DLADAIAARAGQPPQQGAPRRLCQITPLGCLEGLPRGRDRSVDVIGARARGRVPDLLGGGIDPLDQLAAGGMDPGVIDPEAVPGWLLIPRPVGPHLPRPLPPPPILPP